MWTANVLTVFPEIYPANLGISNLKKTKGTLWDLNVIDLKQYALKYGRIDDTPYGGGAGMVLRADVFKNAFDSALSSKQQACKRVYLSPRGRKTDQEDFRKISKSDGLTLLCGRYEGVDQRILDFYGFEEWSLGDFILMGGDVGALAIIEGCVRLIPGVVQKYESIECDSFENGLLEHDQYTKPDVFMGLPVPDILKSGHHAAINKYRLHQSMERTKTSRQDLWTSYIESEVKKSADYSDFSMKRR